MSLDKQARCRQLVEDIQSASVDGVAPSTTSGIGTRLNSRANRLGIPWGEACKRAGVLSAKQARWGQELGEEPMTTYALRALEVKEREKAKAKAKRDLFYGHECVRCLWSRVADEKTVFCMAPSGRCMKHRQPGRVDYGTFGGGE